MHHSFNVNFFVGCTLARVKLQVLGYPWPNEKEMSNVKATALFCQFLVGISVRFIELCP